MQRRRFIGTAAAVFLLPPALGSCLASTVTRCRNYHFFDELFAQAGRLAASWPAADTLVAVQGDVTPFWKDGLERLVREHPLRLRGVTTESFRFCLQTLSQEHAHVDAQISRLDRNLRIWTLHTTPNATTGTRYG